jgi:NAD(P)-dependent dehydrogenase (short-subunit alcohol dehydrogenase family)
LDDPEAAFQAFLARQPMARFGTPEEIAAAAAFLASDEVFENFIAVLPCSSIRKLQYRCIGKRS